MSPDLLQFFAPLTQEEEALLSGAPLDRTHYFADPSILVESWKMIPPGQAITLRTNVRFTEFPMHRHDFVEIMYVLSGTALHTMEDGEDICLQAGEILMINSDTAHCVHRCEKDDIAVNFFILPSFFDFALETMGSHGTLGRFLMDALRAGEKEVPYLYFRVSEVREIQSLMECLIHSLLSNPQGGQMLHKTEMTLLFLHLVNNADCMALSALHRGNALAVSLLQEIHRNYQSLCLTDFAREHNVSCAYISKLARQATGKSPTQLLQDRRLKKAHDLLENTQLSFLDICEAVGYENTSYFYKLFEKTYGLSPAEVRRRSEYAG